MKCPYKGVQWSAPHSKWRADLTHKGKRIHLGLFIDPLVASDIYEEARRSLNQTGRLPQSWSQKSYLKIRRLQDDMTAEQAKRKPAPIDRFTASLRPLPVDEDGYITFGKYCDKLVTVVLKSDPGYLRWACANVDDFKAAAQGFLPKGW